jgi:hypothetical protein
VVYAGRRFKSNLSEKLKGLPGIFRVWAWIGMERLFSLRFKELISIRDGNGERSPAELWRGFPASPEFWLF